MQTSSCPLCCTLCRCCCDGCYPAVLHQVRTTAVTRYMPAQHQTTYHTGLIKGMSCLCCLQQCVISAQVRITAVNKVRNYISYAMALLEEKGHSSVVLKGMGKAINKTVVVGELSWGSV